MHSLCDALCNALCDAPCNALCNAQVLYDEGKICNAPCNAPCIAPGNALRNAQVLYDEGERPSGAKTLTQTRCFNCGKKGHTSQDCEKPQGSTACFVCGAADHQSRSCPHGRHVESLPRHSATARPQLAACS